MKKKDFILIAVLIVIAALSWLIFSPKGGAGGTLVVTLGGDRYGTYPMSENTELVIESELGENTIVIENGEAYFKNADCKDKYCEKQGRISHGGESIVCLPHRLVAEVVSERTEVDAVAR